MPIPWRSRAFTQEEAADLAGLPYSALRSLIHRAAGAAELFSEKQRYRRMFSAADATIARIADDLVKAGLPALIAVAAAYELAAERPAPDAVYVRPARRCAHTAGNVIDDRAIARMRVDDTLIIVPIGKIASEIEAAAAVLHEKEIT